MESPVFKGSTDGKGGSFIGTWCKASGSIGEVGYRFCYTPEYQSDSHTGTKEHGEPGTSGELRLGIIGTQFNGAILGESYGQSSNYKDQHCKEVKPAKLHFQEVEDLVHDISEK